MRQDAARTHPERILDVVIGLLEEHGYDGWHLRHVASTARVSLATIYSLYPSRDELILSAVERWMAENAYMSFPRRGPDQPPLDALIVMFHAIFEPWEQHPAMLDVFVRVITTGAGERMHAQGVLAVAPMGEVFEQLEPSVASDLRQLLPTVVLGALTRYRLGQIAVVDILPLIDRLLLRMRDSTADVPLQD